jgi:hypothetical protein
MAYGVYAALFNAHDNKTLAWFYIRYAPRSQEVQAQLDAVMQQILENGISKHRFALTQKQIPATLIFIRGAVMHALRVLLETNQTTLLKTGHCRSCANDPGIVYRTSDSHRTNNCRRFPRNC